MGSEVPIDGPKSSPVLNARRRRQFFRFSLRFMLLLVAAVAAFLGVRAQYRERFARQMRVIEHLGVLLQGSPPSLANWTSGSPYGETRELLAGQPPYLVAGLREHQRWPSTFYRHGELLECTWMRLGPSLSRSPIEDFHSDAPIGEIVADIVQLESLKDLWILLPGLLKDSHMAAIARLRNLERLYIDCDGLTIRSFENIREMRALERLGIRSLAGGPPKGSIPLLTKAPKLRRLDLDPLELSEDDIHALADRTDLTDLRIANSSLTPSQIAWLTSRLVNTRLELSGREPPPAR